MKEKQIEEMAKYQRRTNNNQEEYNPEYDFCMGCKYFGEPNGCNRFNGTCANYERFIETYNQLEELEDKLEKGTLRFIPKDSVVLSREDKAKLIHINTLKNIKSISQLKELLSNITAINDLMGYNDRELEIRQEASKETTEKIFDLVYDYGQDYFVEEKYMKENDFNQMLNKLKQEVEIKE